MQFEDRYCLLPSGNQNEFDHLNIELFCRGIHFRYSDNAYGQRIYCIPATQLHKLPHDSQGPYLGDNNSGHTIYKINEVAWARPDIDNAVWIEVKP